MTAEEQKQDGKRIIPKTNTQEKPLPDKKDKAVFYLE